MNKIQNTTPPHYELQSVFNDGTQNPAQIVPVSEISREITGMNRRSFLGAGITAFAVMATFPSCAFMKEHAKVRMTNRYGRVITKTLPCGSPIPAGATCTCNCVPGSSIFSSSSYCSCDQVCTCVPVYR